MSDFNLSLRPEPFRPLQGIPGGSIPSAQPPAADPGDILAPQNPQDLPDFGTGRPGKVITELPIWRPPVSLDELVNTTVNQLSLPQSRGAQQRILGDFAAELNRADVIMTSYPARPVYHYPTPELHQQAEKLQQRIAELKGSPDCGQGELTACQMTLSAIHTALQERENPPELKPPGIELL